MYPTAGQREVRSKGVKDAASRMRALEEEIRGHQRRYYVQHKPLISDREFDRLLEELITLEKENPGLASPDSPSRLVGSDLDADFPKFKHTVPILSLGNTYSPGEALEWAAKTLPDPKKKIVVEWKVDGATLVVYYEKGKLVRAVTRGSGQVGDDVTANALTIRNIPHILSRPVDVTVRGEVYMTYADFEAFNEQAGSVYANPRNTAAGSLKLKKSSEVAGRPLRWVAFDAFFKKDKFPTDVRMLADLAELGFPVDPDTQVVPVSQLEKSLASFAGQKGDRPMPVDGLVLKVDDLVEREDLGYTAASPRWAVALKFEPEAAESTVEEIEVFVGRTGRITPRARLTPVKLAGTTVMYATLHNAEFVKELGVKKGSRVRVSKRGEIIPAVEEVIDPGNGPAFKFPVKCPSCKTKLVREEEAVDWRCPNPECEEKIIEGIIFFCQRKQMNIDRLGEKMVRNLWEAGFLRSIEDIYRLADKKEKMLEMEGFGERSVELLLAGIEKSKEREFRYVLPALGLREIGPSVTDILISHGKSDIDSILALASAKDGAEKLAAMTGIGPRTTSAVMEQLTDKLILKRIAFLRKAGLQFAASVPAGGDVDPIFAGQAWCVTGSFENFQPRDVAMDEVRRRGARTVSSVSAKTTHLLAGEGAGSKLEKAKELGVQVVTEADFLKLIGK